MKTFIFKTLVLLSFFIGDSTKTSAQNSVDVPDKIVAHFNSGFSNASTVSWKKTPGTGHYVADFVEGLEYKQVVYSNTGSFLFSETRLAAGQLPGNVSRTMSTQFAGFNMEEIRKVETLREVTVRIRIRNKNVLYEVEIDLSGKVRSKRKLPKVYDDDDHDHEDEKWHKHKKKHKRECHDEDDD